VRDTKTSVLIIGGGPVGLSAAMFLARRGVRPVLVERRDRLSSIPRATGLHARTVEVFREAGLEQWLTELGMEMVGAGVERDKVRARRATPTVMLGGTTLADASNAVVIESHDLRYDDFTPCRGIWCGQDLYEPLLFDMATRHGADIRMGTELVSLGQDADEVTAVVRDRSGGTYTIRATYAVAADGIHSRVRRGLGIGHRSHGDAGDILSIIFRATVELPPSAPHFTWYIVFHPEVMGMLLVMGVDRWMLSILDYVKRGWSAEDFTPQRCTELIRTAVGRGDLKVQVESAKPWKAVHMVADRYRAGRVFLAGDACHAHPPSGGFGVNAGIQDAHNLAWKLDGVLQGWAAERLLDTYEAERRPVGAATADQAWLLTKARMSGLTDEEQDAQRDVIPVAGGYRYRSAAVIGAPDGAEVVPREISLTGEPGSRVPHVWLERDGARISTVDLVGPDFVLLTGAGGAAWDAALAELGTTIPVPVRCDRIGVADGPVDVDGRWARACGISDAGALLVRPDGFVAWRSVDLPAEPTATLRDVLHRAVGAAPVGSAARS
jgi:tetracenomycin A2 monooxygenase-dioxygenase